MMANAVAYYLFETTERQNGTKARERGCVYVSRSVIAWQSEGASANSDASRPAFSLIKERARTLMEGDMDILVLEDDSLLAECLSDEIQSAGDNVIGPFADVQSALRHVDSAQGAILDILVTDGASFPVADALAKKNRPFLFLTGYDCDGLPIRFHKRNVFPKPSSAQSLLQELHSRRTESAPIQDGLQDIILDLLAYARVRMPDKHSAERLVEKALKTAINHVEQGKVETDLRVMLVGLLEQELEGTRARHLQ